MFYTFHETEFFDKNFVYTFSDIFVVRGKKVSSFVYKKSLRK